MIIFDFFFFPKNAIWPWSPLKVFTEINSALALLKKRLVALGQKRL